MRKFVPGQAAHSGAAERAASAAKDSIAKQTAANRAGYGASGLVETQAIAVVVTLVAILRILVIIMAIMARLGGA